jgi:hypothetical protein
MIDINSKITPDVFQHIEIIGVNFPRIAEKIALIWGSPECSDYLQKLTVVEHDRVSRQGFDKKHSTLF